MAEEVTTTNATETVDYKAMYEEVQGKYDKLKTSFDKTASEAADLKRKNTAYMSEEEKRTAELAEREAYYKTIERENALWKYKSSLSSSITDEKVLATVAEAFADGKIDVAIKAQNEYWKNQLAQQAKEIKADLMKQNPQATAQGNSSRMTKEEIMRVADFEQRQALIAQNIDLF